MKTRNTKKVTFDRTTPPIADMAGMSFGRWVVQKFYGWRKTAPTRQTFEMWECRCSCGRVVPVLKTSLIYHRSKQCTKCAAASQTAPDPESIPRRNARPAWQRQQSAMCEAWQDFSVYWGWVQAQKRVPYSQLLRRDQNQPHSPENSYFGSIREAYDEALAVIAETEGWSTDAAMQWAGGLSKKRVYAAAKAILDRRQEVGM